MSIKPHTQRLPFGSGASSSARPFPGMPDMASGLVVVALLVAAATSALSPAAGAILGPPGMVIGGTLMAVLLFRRSRALAWRERRAWLALGVGAAAGALGVLVLAGMHALGHPVPAFGWFDVFFLSSYAALVLALLWLAVAETDGPGWPIVLLDVTVGAVAMVVLVWMTVGEDLVAGFADAPLFQQVVAPMYPIAGIALVLGLMAMTLRRTQFRFDPRLSALGAGLALQVLADLFYLSEGLGGSFAGASPRYDLYLLSFACYVAAAAIVGRAPGRHEFADRPTPMWALMWPYLLAVALVASHVYEMRDAELSPDQIVTMVAAVSVVALVVARQVSTISNHSHRVDSQRRELVASVSHELRTPLTGMLGFLELMDDEPDVFGEEERREIVATVTDQARHLSSVVGDLVVLARDGGRSMPIKPVPTPLEELCRQAIRVSGAPDVELHVHHQVTVEVDASRMTQAIVNLISNAQRYGGPKCRVIAGRTGDDAWIEVHDDGPGVPARSQKAIWNQFERAHHRYDASAPGLGIGLAITRAVAVAHGGSATYRRSEILDGACFVITVPIGRRR